jgi:hypothetical protein
MAVNSHAPRPEVGHELSLAMGRPPYDVAAPSRQCDGEVFGRRCERNSTWLLPEVNYCGTHVPAAILPLVLIRRDLWISLAADLWREVLADCPWVGPIPLSNPPPSRYPKRKRVHYTSIRYLGSSKYAACLCGWNGPCHQQETDAADDAVAHQAEAEAAKEPPTD